MLTQKIFHFHLKAHCTNLTVKCEWSSNSRDFNHLTINVWEARMKTFYKLNKFNTILELKAALQQIRDDLLQTFTISFECICFGRW